MALFVQEPEDVKNTKGPLALEGTVMPLTSQTLPHIKSGALGGRGAGRLFILCGVASYVSGSKISRVSLSCAHNPDFTDSVDDNELPKKYCIDLVYASHGGQKRIVSFRNLNNQF